ncbi:tRNA (adenosine(37)-N6)-dimethylallyltransferase MiaA [Rhodovulum sulfidophilum]|uniref:tRNA (adenosine(37)-N6)-dimethylallyltransferase MiaA n=1 Tax=Rhodovulum sulfidophilum TaxID=35806 RepID=UPI0019293CDE|nr:tRNA (adenosine(37)-N6)-dimethylallyltransferase MiaA [Rhodovulum sulfidophilum]MBL3584593.1 tRNA (adenosine(37)-N6)-dimethylallyltransferase MiaA [Rhodovulum sulfidophilum]
MSEKRDGFNAQQVGTGATGLPDLDPDRPVLIAGPTASGKSALALAIAEAQGGVIVNADALQVFEGWQVLTARPGPDETARVPHALYGHVPFTADYSVGHWLRDLAPLLEGSERPIVVGGTGLYFTALTEGLAEIPPTPPEIRAEADRRLASEGHEALLDALDADTLARIDRRNPVRVQRAWEVQQATGRGLAAWQDETPPPLLPPGAAQPVVIEAGRDWLNARIDARFERMMKEGALEEVRANLPRWDPALLSAKAIGAPDLVAYLRGEMPLAEAVAAAKTASRQYAKRQRSWFRSRLRNWPRWPAG